MRLYNIYYVCKIAYRKLRELEYVAIGNNEVKLTGWQDCKQALESLYAIDFVKEDVRKAYEVINPIDRESASPIIGNMIFKKFRSLYEKVIQKAEAVVDLYESIKEKGSQQGIDVKIPTCKTLKEYIEILKDMEFIVTQCPYLKSKDEEIQYKGTDVGSDWITFGIVTIGAVSGSFYILNNLATIVNKAISLRSNKKVLDMQEEMYKTMQAKNKISQEIIDAFYEMKKMTLKKYVDELGEEIGKVSDGEEESKVSISLEKLSNLLDKGVEIYSSIETPKEIKVLFPFSESQAALPDNLMKYIEAKTSDEDN